MKALMSDVAKDVKEDRNGHRELKDYLLKHIANQMKMFNEVPNKATDPKQTSSEYRGVIVLSNGKKFIISNTKKNPKQR